MTRNKRNKRDRRNTRNGAIRITLALNASDVTALARLAEQYQYVSRHALALAALSAGLKACEEMPGLIAELLAGRQLRLGARQR